MKGKMVLASKFFSCDRCGRTFKPKKAMRHLKSEECGRTVSCVDCRATLEYEGLIQHFQCPHEMKNNMKRNRDISEYVPARKKMKIDSDLVDSEYMVVDDTRPLKRSEINKLVKGRRKKIKMDDKMDRILSPLSPRPQRVHKKVIHHLMIDLNLDYEIMTLFQQHKKKKISLDDLVDHLYVTLERSLKPNIKQYLLEHIPAMDYINMDTKNLVRVK